MHIRTTKTSSDATAIQVVRYIHRKMEVLTHVGSARNESDLLSLKKIASDWIHGKNNEQMSFVPQFNEQISSTIVQIDKCQYRGFRYQLFYDCLWGLAVKFKFHLISEPEAKPKVKMVKILNDLVIARIAAPSSKLESFDFISDYFGITHGRRDFYRTLSELPLLKSEVEAKVIAVAKKNFGFNFSLVFYDLTTLYFESFETDDLRRIGFSKDNKASNPQIMIGLLVNDLGFPVSYQIFPGNKFEGHTLMPSINSIRKKHKIKQMTVVADSAMISDQNVEFLKAEKLHYIVAARTANLPMPTIEEIAKQLNQKDEVTIRMATASKGDLICSFSDKRYRKEKREMEKQLAKAELILKTPSAAEIIKRTKFLKGKKQSYELNQDLIRKTTLLLGIKGYYSNCSDLSNEEIIKHYKNLWQVEKSFRISKSDLKTRPIFHNKQQAVEAHILICFMALALAKYIEIKTKKSIKSVTKELKKVTDARIYDQINKREFVMRSGINETLKEILREI
jgi:transposase